MLIGVATTSIGRKMNVAGCRRCFRDDERVAVYQRENAHDLSNQVKAKQALSQQMKAGESHLPGPATLFQSQHFIIRERESTLSFMPVGQPIGLRNDLRFPASALASAGPGEGRFRRRGLAENERKSEGHAEAQLTDGTTVNRRIAHRRVERQLVVHLPYGSDQAGKSLRLRDDAVRIDFKNWPDFPFDRSLNDGVEKKLAMLIGREIRGRIEVNRSPVPALRHYSGQPKSDTRSSAGCRQQRTELRGDAGARFVLKDAGLKHVLQENGVGNADRTNTFG
jgi:hypothetical protein